MLLRIIFLVHVLIFSTSCILSSESPVESSSDDVNLIQRGDIIVTNTGNDSIVLLNSEGTFKSTLVDDPTSTTYSYNGLAYDDVNNKVLFTYDHTTNTLDAVRAIDLYDGEITTVLTNNQLQGTLPGVARLTGGDLLILETNTTVEKFSSAGVRVGAPFIGAATSAVVDVTRLSNGGFILCSSGTANTVRIYNAAGVVQGAAATSASPIPSLGALAASSCTQGPDGTIYVAYSGGTDAVRAYNSTMTTTLWTFTDTNVLTTPGKLAVKENGNILVTDTGFHHIVEISTTGGLVQVIGGAGLNGPNNIVVVK